MTPDIQDFIIEKMNSLQKFFTQSDQEQILVEFEVSRSTHHKKGDVFRAEANISLKGKLYRGESNTYDVRVAIDAVRDEIEHQVNRTKTKRFELVKKGARIIKNMLKKNNG